MSYFDYAEAGFEVREDLKAAHRAYWRRLAAPGSWWTGADRVAIAMEARAARSCSYCAERKASLSPYTGADRHDSVSGLPVAAVDAVHRIMTDQNRIKQSWIASNVDQGLSEEAYVELAGIVVALISIDDFHLGIGVPFEALPEPMAGDPDHYRPEHLTRDTGFVPMLTRDGAVGAEADLWGERSANVLRALTLVPNALRDWKMLSAAQYLSIEGMANFVKDENRSIDRAQMELVAGRVSSYNECFY